MQCTNRISLRKTSASISFAAAAAAVILCTCSTVSEASTVATVSKESVNDVQPTTPHYSAANTMVCDSATKIEGEVVLKCNKPGQVILSIEHASFGNVPAGTGCSFESSLAERFRCNNTDTVMSVADSICKHETNCSISPSAHIFGIPNTECAASRRSDLWVLSVSARCGYLEADFAVDNYFASWSAPKWEIAAAEVAAERTSLAEHLNSIPPYPEERFSGRGIIIVAGGKYLNEAMVNIAAIRGYGSTLRIQVWYKGIAELPDQARPFFDEFLVELYNIYDFVSEVQLLQSNVGGRPFQLKPMALMYTDLEEVLLLDADSVPVSDPAKLFSMPQYLETGTIFWPDYWKTATDNPIWDVVPEASDDKTSWEQESGQVLVNKRVAWEAVNMCLRLQTNFYYSLLNGDKDTFRFSWRAAHVPFEMVPYWPTAVGSIRYSLGGEEAIKENEAPHWIQQEFCGHSMAQHDFDGNVAFLHHNHLHVEHPLPAGHNFAWMQEANLDEEEGRLYRANPKPSMVDADGNSVNCFAIEYASIVDSNITSELVTPSSFLGWETYFLGCRSMVEKYFIEESPWMPRVYRQVSNATTTSSTGTARRDRRQDEPPIVAPTTLSSKLTTTTTTPTVPSTSDSTSGASTTTTAATSTSTPTSPSTSSTSSSSSSTSSTTTTTTTTSTTTTATTTTATTATTATTTTSTSTSTTTTTTTTTTTSITSTTTTSTTTTSTKTTKTTTTTATTSSSTSTLTSTTATATTTSTSTSTSKSTTTSSTSSTWTFVPPPRQEQRNRRKKENDGVGCECKGWYSTTINGVKHCYKYFNRVIKKVLDPYFVRQTWAGARDECTSNTDGNNVHLATIDRWGENKFVEDVIYNQNQEFLNRPVWLGGKRNNANTTAWEWVDDSEWVYDNWRAGEPSNTVNLRDGGLEFEGCLQMTQPRSLGEKEMARHNGDVGSGDWNDAKCDKLRGYVCEFVEDIPTSEGPCDNPVPSHGDKSNQGAGDNGTDPNGSSSTDDDTIEPLAASSTGMTLPVLVVIVLLIAAVVAVSMLWCLGCCCFKSSRTETTTTPTHATITNAAYEAPNAPDEEDDAGDFGNVIGNLATRDGAVANAIYDSNPQDTHGAIGNDTYDTTGEDNRGAIGNDTYDTTEFDFDETNNDEAEAAYDDVGPGVTGFAADDGAEAAYDDMGGDDSGDDFEC